MAEANLTLHFGLKPGARADLEIVASAALHWVSALRAAARELDPGADIHVEIIDAFESSLRLNTFLDWAERALERFEVGTRTHPRLRRLAIALAIFIPTVGYPTYDFYFGSDVAVLSDEDRQRLDELLDRLQKNPVVSEEKQKFFNQVEKDDSITEVGFAEHSKGRPVILVPRSQFAERGGLWALHDEVGERSTYPVVDVVLVGPILLPQERSWRFRSEAGEEFSASMRDKRFLKALARASVQESLSVGIQMSLRLKLDEKKVGGVWILKKRGRSVIEVLSPKVA
jgi:hypothetical protein